MDAGQGKQTSEQPSLCKPTLCRREGFAGRLAVYSTWMGENRRTPVLSAGTRRANRFCTPDPPSPHRDRQAGQTGRWKRSNRARTEP